MSQNHPGTADTIQTACSAGRPPLPAQVSLRAHHLAAAYDLQRGGKLAETLLCRTCTARLKAAEEGLRHA